MSDANEVKGKGMKQELVNGDRGAEADGTSLGDTPAPAMETEQTAMGKGDQSSDRQNTEDAREVSEIESKEGSTDQTSSQSVENESGAGEEAALDAPDANEQQGVDSDNTEGSGNADSAEKLPKGGDSDQGNLDNLHAWNEPAPDGTNRIAAENHQEPKIEKAALPDLKLIDIDATEGILHAKQALTELETLLDEFDKPAVPNHKPHEEDVDDKPSEYLTASQLDKRLEEITSMVTSAVAASKSAPTVFERTEKAKGGGLFTGLLAIIALVLSAASFKLMLDTSDRLEGLGASGAQATPDGEHEIDRLRMEFQHLSEKVNEMSVSMERQGGSSSERVDERDTEVKTQAGQQEQQVETDSEEEATAQIEEAEKAADGQAGMAAPPPGGGRWVINLTSFRSEKVADSEIGRLRDIGIPVEKQRVISNGNVWFRLRIPGLSTYDDAKIYMEELGQLTDISSAWITNQ